MLAFYKVLTCSVFLCDGGCESLCKTYDFFWSLILSLLLPKKKLHDYCNLSRINKKEKKRRDFMILALMDSKAYDYLGKFWQTLGNFLKMKWNQLQAKC